MFGCTQKEKDEIEETKGSESEQEIILSDSNDPIISEDELTGIEWDDDLMPWKHFFFLLS